MALYFLSYDLRAKKDYQKLYDELNKFDAIKILKSDWCFNRVDTTAKGLREHFKQFIDSDDGLLVSQVTDWASFNAEKTPNDLK